MVIYCTPYILHDPITAVPTMATLSQRMPATTMISHDNCGAQGNKTRNTPHFTMEQHLNGKRLHQKCADKYMDFHYTYKLDLKGTQKVM
jgi:hypothetical protein